LKVIYVSIWIVYIVIGRPGGRILVLVLALYSRTDFKRCVSIGHVVEETTNPSDRWVKWTTLGTGA
jgi:hypothetical protein